MFLIFDSLEDALSRADEEGAKLGLHYHRRGSGTRYVSYPIETIEGNYALDVTGYDLTEDEAKFVVDSFTPQEYGD